MSRFDFNSDFLAIPIPDSETDESLGWDEEISPECRAMLAMLDVPVELLDFDYGDVTH